MADNEAIMPPAKLAHFVLRTSRYTEMVEWYQVALNAKPVFQNDQLCFLTYDDEHHRVAIANMPDLVDQAEGVAGVHHIAFTYDSLQTLLENFERLKRRNIEPIFPINHGPTTSIYYADPDGNQLEFQIENFATVEETGRFFNTPEFAENPIGVEFDPEDLLRRLRSGEADSELKKRPEIGARDLSNVTLR